MSKKILVCFIALSIVAFTPLVFGERDFKDLNEFGYWAAFYYLHPEPQRASEAIEYFSGSVAYESNSRTPLVYFFSRILKDNSPMLPGVFEVISKSDSEKAKAVFLNALWYVNSPKSRELIQRAGREWKTPLMQDIVPKLIEHQPIELTTARIDSALQLDMLWTAFGATGAEWPIRQIISAVHLEKEGHGEEKIVGAAAEWSLGINAKQHKKVCLICKEEINNNVGVTKEFLKKITADCEPGPGKFSPGAANEALKRGTVLAESGKQDEAIEQFTEAIKADPKNANAYYDRGLSHALKGNLDQAISDFNSALEIQPNGAAAYMNRGYAYYKKGNIDHAISDYNTAVQIKPDFFEAYRNRGDAYAKRGEYDKAIADFSKALEINSDYFPALGSRTISYFMKKDYEKCWMDVHEMEVSGYKVGLKLLEDLKKASGRDQ